MFAPYQEYPSGHVSRATVVAVALLLRRPLAGLRPVSAWSSLSSGAATIYTGGHYSEEVIGGALLGWASRDWREGLRR